MALRDRLIMKGDLSDGGQKYIIRYDGRVRIFIVTAEACYGFYRGLSWIGLRDIINDVEAAHHDWSEMVVSRVVNGIQYSYLKFSPFPKIEGSWSSQSHEISSYKFERIISNTAWLVSLSGARQQTKVQFIAKLSFRETDIVALTKETSICRRLNGLNIGPKFIAHLTANGRTIGMLLEYIDGRKAMHGDGEACRNTLERLHNEAHLVHGDVHSENFVMSNGKAVLIDFELAHDWSKGAANRDMGNIAFSEEMREDECGRSVSSDESTDDSMSDGDDDEDEDEETSDEDADDNSSVDY